MGSESSAKLSTNCGVEEHCFNMMSHKKNLHSVNNMYVSTDIRRSTRPIRSQQTVTKVGKKDIRTIYTFGH